MTMVVAVRAVRRGRRRMVEMPMAMAAMTVLNRETSAACTVLVRPWRTFSSCSNFRMMMTITSDDSTITVNPRKMIAGVFEMAKAGWVK